MINDHESVERILEAIYALTTAVNEQTETIANYVGNLRDTQEETNSMLAALPGVINAGELAFDISSIQSSVIGMAERAAKR